MKAKKPWLFIVPVVVCLALVAILAILPAQADEPEAAKKPELAPLNPEFTAFQQNPPAEFYGYIPPPVDLRHLKDIPVKKQAHNRQASLPKSFVSGSGLTMEQLSLLKPLEPGG